MEKYLYILMAALCLSACSKHEKTQKDQTPLRVKTMVVALQAGSATSRYVGAIEPAKETPLSLQTTGRVVSVNAKNGQRVHKGQTILAVDNTQALNAVQSAEASLRHAQDGYDRVAQVHAKGVVSDQKMVEIESQLTQAKSLYAAAKEQLNQCTLIAPCDGVINGLEVQNGQTIIPGVKLCSILDVSGFSVRFTVPESEIRHLADRGEVECPAINAVFPVTITEKSVTANPVTHTYDVVARVQGGKDVLMTGMVAKVQISKNEVNRALAAENQQSPVTNPDIVIPAQCVLLKQEGPTVWVIENGKAVRREITTGGYQADGVRVTSGLNAGDTLIVEGYQKLYKDCNVIED